MGSRKFFLTLFTFSLSLLVTGFLLSTPFEILQGLKVIVSTEGTLITDYFALAGPGAALVNSALVTMICIAFLYFSHDPVSGKTVITVGLMSGFAFFGKNLLNIWPIVFGAWLYALYQKEPVHKYTSIGFLGTTLSPFVSFIALRQSGTPDHIAIGILTGLIIGFVLPPLADHTFRIQNGMNLYNMGFAAGLLAMILVSLAQSMGQAPELTYNWSTEYNGALTAYLIVTLAALFISAFVLDRQVLKTYVRLVKSRGHAPNDYLVKFGAPAVLLNASLCGALALIYIKTTGGVLNGPTLGAVFTIMSFASSGKNPRNIFPVMLGVLIGSLLNTWQVTSPSVQLSGLFCTALAPLTDYFGGAVGILAGFLHSSVVLYAGSPLAGLNLYNNGFAAGIVATVLYPVLCELLKHKRAKLDDVDYIEYTNKDDNI